MQADHYHDDVINNLNLGRYTKLVRRSTMARKLWSPVNIETIEVQHYLLPV